MLALLQAHPIACFALLVALVLVVLPLARGGTIALRSWRARRELAQQTAAQRAAGAALDVLTALAATLVLSTEAEVRDLKDPLKPGGWNPATDGPRFLGRVVGDLRDLGGASVAQLRALQGLTTVGVTKLLASIAEAQVQKLRATAPPAVVVVPAKPPAVSAEAPAVFDPTATWVGDAADVRAALAAHDTRTAAAALRDAVQAPTPEAALAALRSADTPVEIPAATAQQRAEAAARRGRGE